MLLLFADRGSQNLTTEDALRSLIKYETAKARVGWSSNFEISYNDDESWKNNIFTVLGCSTTTGDKTWDSGMERQVWGFWIVHSIILTNNSIIVDIMVAALEHV